MTRIAIGRIAGAGLLAIGMLATPLKADAASIVVRNVNLHPATPAEAKRVVLKIDDAALRVCGASGFSLAEAKAAMRASSCWQEAAGNAVLRSGSLLLERAFDRIAPPTIGKGE
jgi:UrcA family protein